jgi:hypothetical protein
MFKSKPSQPVQRTTNPILLAQKATAFLDKNYTRYDPNGGLPEIFYMLEPNSINGMKKISMPARHRSFDNVAKIYTTPFSEVTYKNLSDGEIHKPNMIPLTVKLSEPIWYRNINVFGNSASDAVLGGTRRRKSTRRQRKSRRR